MVLIETKNGRKCDARCYNAKGKKCTCVCGGINHGIGLEAALEKMNVIIDALCDVTRENSEERNKEEK